MDLASSETLDAWAKERRTKARQGELRRLKNPWNNKYNKVLDSMSITQLRRIYGPIMLGGTHGQRMYIQGDTQALMYAWWGSLLPLYPANIVFPKRNTWSVQMYQNVFGQGASQNVLDGMHVCTCRLPVFYLCCTPDMHWHALIKLPKQGLRWLFDMHLHQQGWQHVNPGGVLTIQNNCCS